MLSSGNGPESRIGIEHIYLVQGFAVISYSNYSLFKVIEKMGYHERINFGNEIFGNPNSGNFGFLNKNDIFHLKNINDYINFQMILITRL